MLKHLLIQRALTEEASHFWKRSAVNPAAAVPDTFNMTGFVVDADRSKADLPTALHALPEGALDLSPASAARRSARFSYSWTSATERKAASCTAS
ncbi:MAG: hypothetical protein HC788_13795 [Sphingopyxis sp.]|nr:hypothetical protein [Sphingopyxis sp.]